MKKQILMGFLCLVNSSIFGQMPSGLQGLDSLKKDSIQSSLDGNTQIFYYSKAIGTTAQPLVVGLHSWSNTAETQKNLISNEVQA